MELRKVNVEDIYPDEKNPRKKFGDIDALAASFELNEMNPGEPINPPVVVQDGGIYRIVDGERRYRAIKKNKITQCNVVVCDDISEANTMIAMLATDDKVQLSDLEKSRGVQQMLLLGVDPVKVEKTARLKAGDAMRINKAMLKIDDAAEDMTLDRLFAIAEFAEDPEAVEELSNCHENAWETLAANLRRKSSEKKNRGEMKALLDECGIDIIEDKAGTKTEDYFYTAKKLAAGIEKYGAEEGLVAWYDSNDGSYELRVPKPETESTEESELDRKVEEFTKSLEQGAQERIAFFSERIGFFSSMKRVMEIVVVHIGKEIWDVVEEEFGPEFIGDPKNTTINPSLAAFGYCKAVPFFSSYSASEVLKGRSINQWSKDGLTKWKKWVDAFIADGFEPNQQEQEFIALCEVAIQEEESNG